MAQGSEAWVLDSSVWVALFLDADTNSEKAEKIFKTLFGPIYIPYIVLAEVGTVLTYRHSKQQADNFIHFVSDDARCVVIESRSSEDIVAFLNGDTRMSFADIAVLECARSLSATLITFDKEMKRAYAGGAQR